MMADFIGHVDNRLDSANAKIIAERKREKRAGRIHPQRVSFLPNPG